MLKLPVTIPSQIENISSEDLEFILSFYSVNYAYKHQGYGLRCKRCSTQVVVGSKRSFYRGASGIIENLKELKRELKNRGNAIGYVEYSDAVKAAIQHVNESHSNIIACEHCFQIVTPRGLKRHQASVDCLVARREKDLTSRGYERADALIERIKASMNLLESEFSYQNRDNIDWVLDLHNTRLEVENKLLEDLGVFEIPSKWESGGYSNHGWGRMVAERWMPAEIREASGFLIAKIARNRLIETTQEALSQIADLAAIAASGDREKLSTRAQAIVALAELQDDNEEEDPA